MNSPNLKPPINVPAWIEQHEQDFLPPICNKMLYNDQLKVFFVGGPNQRSDYHIELGEEFFYQLQGDMCLNIVERGQHKSIWIRQGEVFLLPARIPHSPQRKASTMGLVIERERATNELDGLRYYYMDGTKNSILYERWFHCIDLGTQLAPIIKAYHESEEYRTGLPSSTKNSRLIEPPPPPYSDDTTTMVDDPINLNKWLKCNKQEIDHVGHKALFVDSHGHRHHHQTRINVFGGNFKHLISSDDHHPDDGAAGETFLWQIV